MAVVDASSPEFCCRLCGSDELSLYFCQGNDERFKYYKCARCSLVNLDLATGMDQSQYTEPEVIEDPEDESGRFNQWMGQSFDYLIERVSNVRSFCDIGSGNGRLLLLARRRGWRVLGIELSEAVAEQTARKLGVEVIAGDFLDIDIRPEHARAFDVVCMRHVLEHLPDSKLAMRRIRALLRPGGHALLEMPNIESLDKRIKRWLVRSGLHKREFPADFVAGHCNEFCRRSFEHLLGETGFRLVHWETYSKRPLGNWVVNRVHIGSKARALIQATD